MLALDFTVVRYFARDVAHVHTLQAVVNDYNLCIACWNVQTYVWEVFSGITSTLILPIVHVLHLFYLLTLACLTLLQ